MTFWDLQEEKQRVVGEKFTMTTEEMMPTHLSIVTRREEVSTPDTPSSGSSSRGKEASTQICGFQVLQDMRSTPTPPKKEGELSVKGSSLLSKQLRTPTPPKVTELKKPNLRIRTPRRKQNVNFPKELKTRRDSVERKESMDNIDTQVGALLITSL